MKGELKFDKKKHVYSKGKVIYTPVTEFVKSFFREFDEKAIAKKLVYVYRRRGEKTTARAILKGWKEKAKYGSMVHKQIEDYLNKKIDFHELCTPATLGAEIHHKLFSRMDEPVDYAEFRVHDDDLKIAGTVDLVFFENGEEFTIVDWKTSSKINFKGWEKSPHPLMKDEEDCNYTHYVLQLSLYAYILELRGFTCKQLYIAHINGIESTLIPVPYREDMIRKMIEWRNENEKRHTNNSK